MESQRSSISLEDEYPTCQQSITDRPPSSTSSRALTREEVTVMSDNELDVLCRQVFALCDTDGDGYITAEVSNVKRKGGREADRITTQSHTIDSSSVLLRATVCV